MGTSSKALARKLEKVAGRQHGCFTAAQAIRAGYADSVHLYHVRTGSWIRLFRGVYRLASFAKTPLSRCMACLLWTRDKSGRIQGVLAPPTLDALQAGSLSISDPIHIAVDKHFRRSSSVPEGIKLATIDPSKHKTSKYMGLPALGIRPSVPSKPTTPSLPSASQHSMPDYYDWLDYQAVLCDRPD